MPCLRKLLTTPPTRTNLPLTSLIRRERPSSRLESFSDHLESLVASSDGTASSLQSSLFSNGSHSSAGSLEESSLSLHSSLPSSSDSLHLCWLLQSLGCSSDQLLEFHSSLPWVPHATSSSSTTGVFQHLKLSLIIPLLSRREMRPF